MGKSEEGRAREKGQIRRRWMMTTGRGKETHTKITRIVFFQVIDNTDKKVGISLCLFLSLPGS